MVEICFSDVHQYGNDIVSELNDDVSVESLSYSICSWEILEDNEDPQSTDIGRIQKQDKRMDQLRLSLILLATHTCISIGEVSREKIHSFILYLFKAGGIHILCQLSTCTPETNKDERHLSGQESYKGKEASITTAFKKLFLSRKAVLLFTYITLWVSFCNKIELLVTVKNSPRIQPEVPYSTISEQDQDTVWDFEGSNETTVSSPERTILIDYHQSEVISLLNKSHEEVSEEPRSFQSSIESLDDKASLTDTDKFLSLPQENVCLPVSQNMSQDTDSSSSPQHVLSAESSNNLASQNKTPSTVIMSRRDKARTSEKLQSSPRFLKKYHETKSVKIHAPIFHITTSSSIRQEIHFGDLKCPLKIVIKNTVHQTTTPPDQCSGALTKRTKVISVFTQVIERKQHKMLDVMKFVWKRVTNNSLKKLIEENQTTKHDAKTTDMRSILLDVWSNPYMD